MPRGREPEGEAPLSNAERQARYRARHKQQQPVVIVRPRRPVDRRSRVQRWRDGIAGGSSWVSGWWLGDQATRAPTSAARSFLPLLRAL